MGLLRNSKLKLQWQFKVPLKTVKDKMGHVCQKQIMGIKT